MLRYFANLDVFSRAATINRLVVAKQFIGFSRFSKVHSRNSPIPVS